MSAEYVVSADGRTMYRRGSRTGKSWPFSGTSWDYLLWDVPRPERIVRVRPPSLVVAIALGVTR